ncbi:hypothetical protein F4824DRAFT_506747 [Ustulina deusta]|nr:hypothetical protein F4824DRAFT_506747 [Ustulina deusta]
MSFNRIAIYGHRGWVGSPVLRALAAAGAPIEVPHRAGSDISTLPAGVVRSTGGDRKAAQLRKSHPKNDCESVRAIRFCVPHGRAGPAGTRKQSQAGD